MTNDPTKTTDPTNALYSLVLALTPAGEATIGATMGHQAHAAFLRTIQEADPMLAAELHDPDEPVRSFTVSPLQGVPHPHNGQVQLSPGRDCWLRFTLLQPGIFERFMARFLQSGDRPAIRLGQAELLIREILVTPGAHPWSGYTTCAELLERARPEPEITLDFASPTAFGFGQMAWGKKSFVLPDPEPVFSSLARSWNGLAPPPLQIDRVELQGYINEHVVVKRLHGLETQMLRFSRSPQIGFVGCVTFGLMSKDDAARRLLNALADFAFYAGVGMKTAMGMGMVRRVDRPGE
jgi:CRISPR-associated endoribonuclease Cas6